MPVLISHVTGNVNSRQAAWSLAEHGWLEAFHTTIAWEPPHGMAKLFPRSLCETLSKRRLPPSLAGHVRTHPVWEGLRLACRLLGHEKWLGIDQVAERFDKAVAEDLAKRTGVSAVYAYMDAAHRTFEMARKSGVKTIYELPTPYWRATREIIEREKQRHPDWAATLPEMHSDSLKMRSRDAELALADVVIVPSDFVRDSLSLAPEPPREIRVVPYGCPEPERVAPAQHDPSKPLKLLYVGTLGQGKGLADLDACLRLLTFPVELTLIGSKQEGADCQALNSMLSQHRWLSGLSREQVLAEMRQHNLLVLPTHYEGMALVAGEAFSCGMPVITTPSSGLQGVMQDGVQGWFVPGCDAGALAACLYRMASEPYLIETMGNAALQLAARCSWAQYRNHLGKVVAECLN